MSSHQCHISILRSIVAVVWFVQTATAWADVPNAYRELVPGTASIADVQQALGLPPIDTAGRHDFRYPVEDRPGLNDRLFFRRGKLQLVTAASGDPRYLTRAEIVGRFGEPEARVEFETQEFLDYGERGLRFVCDAQHKTIGIVYFVPMRRRVPAGYPNVSISLRQNSSRKAAAIAPEDFRVGAAQVSIAPERFDNLTANAASELPHLAEDLFARAAVFARGSTKIALVGLDVFGMGAWDLDRLRGMLADDGFSQVIIAMSHTHANVDTIGFYGYYPKEYAQHVLKQSRAAVLKAAGKMKPVQSLKLGSVEMPLHGGRVVDLIRNARDPGIVDPTVSILQAIGQDGKPIVNVIHLSCHPEVIDLKRTGGLSPDFVGSLTQQVTQELGGQAVFLNGALGGMVTPDTRFRTQAAAEKMGRELARYVVQAAGLAQPSGSYALWMKRRPVEYPITGESVLQFLKNAPGPIDLHEGRVSTEMNVLWIGDAQFVTVPGELLPEIGFEIMSQMRGRLRLIVGLANGELGYLVPSYDFRAGHYEERTGPGAAGGAVTRSVGLELAPLTPPSIP
jgi:hypothetical protein